MAALSPMSDSLSRPADADSADGSAADPALVDEENDSADASVSESAGSRFPRGLPAEGKWEQEAVLHLGARSTLAPPDNEKRRARRVGVGGYHRHGWDEFADEPPPKKARGRGERGGRGGRGGRGRGRGRGRWGRGRGLGAVPPGDDALSEPAPSYVHTPPDDDGGADLLALEMRASGKRARQVRPAGGWPQDESEEEAGGPPSGGPARKKPRQPKPDRALVSAAGGTPGADSSPGPAAAPVGEWRNGFYFSVPHTEVIPGVMLCGRLGIPDAADAAEPAAPKKRRHRGKKSDEGDLPELKPRHLRGKRKEEADARTAHNASLSESRRAAAMLLPPPGDLPPAEAVEGALSRMLRPKTRRWCVYEWFESPVDVDWFRNNEFVQALGACGLGQLATLTRSEWSFVRSLLPRARRFSPSFVADQRRSLDEHREQVRERRRLFASRSAGGMLDECERLDSMANAQLAVGQRVSAFHPRTKHLHTGTILTPDGDHYKVQFDWPKLGVHVVEDIFVSPLLDGSRGIDYTSPRTTPADADPGMPTMDSTTVGIGKLMAAAAGAVSGKPPKADENELQLLAYLLRLLKRKRIIINETRRTCKEAEAALRASGNALHARGVPADGVVVADDSVGPKVDVTAAQQRQLGQVPPPPLLPLLHTLLGHWSRVDPAIGEALVRDAARWSQEIAWLQDALRRTSRRVEEAMLAMKPMAQRFSLALGAVAPEPISYGFGVNVCSQMRDHSQEAALAILSRRMAEGGRPPSAGDDTSAPAAAPGPSRVPPPDVFQRVVQALMLLLQVQAWAAAPVDSAAECRFAFTAALEALIPESETEPVREEFSGVLSAAQALQMVLSAGCAGAADPSRPAMAFAGGGR